MLRAIRSVTVLYGVLAMIAAAVIGLLLALVGVLPFVPLPRTRRERYTLVAASWWALIVVRGLLFVRDDVRGAPPDPSQGALVLCNHRSWLDPILLMAHTRSNGLSKAEIFWIPILGQLGWLTGAVFFDRRNKHGRARARREVLDLVRAGHRVQVFPEGTRTRTGEIGERVYLAIPMDCYREGLPVVCCAVWGTERVLPATEWACLPGQRVRLHLGPTLYPRDFPDARAFAQACWDQVQRDVSALRAEEEEPQPAAEPSPHCAPRAAP